MFLLRGLWVAGLVARGVRGAGVDDGGVGVGEGGFSGASDTARLHEITSTVTVESNTVVVATTPPTTPPSPPTTLATSTKSSGTPKYKPHVESTAPGFHDAVSSVPDSRAGDSTSTMTTSRGVDLGSLIQSLLPPPTTLLTALPVPVPTIHFEESKSGWDEAPNTDTKPNPRPTETKYHESHAAPQSAPDPSTIAATTPAAPRRPANQPPTPDPAVTPPDRPSIRPVPVTHTQSTTADGVATVTHLVSYAYVLDSTTLALFQPVTRNGVPIALATDSAGATVLRAGDQTTTLPAPPPPQMLNQVLATATVDGTEVLLVGGHTLMPGGTVTVGGARVEIQTAEGKTVVVVGEVTTTVGGAVETGGSGKVGAVGSASASLGVTGTVDAGGSATAERTAAPTSSSGAGVVGVKGVMAGVGVLVGVLVQ